MGYLTTITFRNDEYHSMTKDELFEIYQDNLGNQTTHSNSHIGHKPIHSSEIGVYISYGNTSFNLSDIETIKKVDKNNDILDYLKYYFEQLTENNNNNKGKLNIDIPISSLFELPTQEELFKSLSSEKIKGYIQNEFDYIEDYNEKISVIVYTIKDLEEYKANNLFEDKERKYVIDYLRKYLANERTE